MRLWSHAGFPFPLPERHRYPLPKYPLLRERCRSLGHDVRTPEAIDWAALERVHDPSFVDRMRRGDLDHREERVLGLPWSPELIERARRGTQGTLEAARDALGGQRIGFVLGSGTHHAGRASARGYCVFNDLAVCASELRRDGVASRVLVVDCDVHQGDGTAELLRPDPDAFALSVHSAVNYPFKKVPSDLDVDLPRGTQDAEYLAALDDALEQAWRRFGVPDLVLYLAGVDPWEGDALGRLALTRPGLRARDELVLDRALADDVPIVVTLAGGYPPEILDGVEMNLATVEAASLRAGPAPPLSVRAA